MTDDELREAFAGESERVEWKESGELEALVRTLADHLGLSLPVPTTGQQVLL